MTRLHRCQRKGCKSYAMKGTNRCRVHHRNRCTRRRDTIILDLIADDRHLR